MFTEINATKAAPGENDFLRDSSASVRTKKKGYAPGVREMEFPPVVSV